MGVMDAGTPGPTHPVPDEALTGATDRRLMEAVAAGSREAFGVLVERYWVRLVGFSTGILDSPDGAEDVVQEAFIRVWARRSDWTPHGSVTGYLYAVTRNLSLNALRRRCRIRERHEHAAQLHPVLPRDPGEILEERRIDRFLEEAIRALPERRREVFLLARFHGLSYGQIAQVMAISPQTVANQMSAALDDLRGALEPVFREP